MTAEVKKFIRNELHMTSDSDFLDIVTVSEGKSGAEIYKINIRSTRNRDNGTYIIKVIDTRDPWYEQSYNESDKSKEIIADSPKFVDRLVKNKGDSIIGNQHVIIYDYANNSELQSVSLERLEKNQQTKWLKKISCELLSAFNDSLTSYKYDGRFFEDLLTYRLDENGSFEKKSNNLLYDADKGSICVKEELYPNPYYYIKNKHLWEDKIKTHFYRSRLHGDLHRKNIITLKTSNANDEYNYVIIDYDSYKKEAPILFDHAYLELSCYMETFPNNDLQEWMEVIQENIDEDIFGEISLHQNMLSFATNGICGGIKEWCLSDDLKQSQDAVRIQFAMARVAAGINFFSKNAFQSISELQRLMIYIAINLKKMFSYINYDWLNGEPTTFVMDREGNDYTNDIWKECKRFEHMFTKILLSTDVYQNSEYEKIVPITRIDWSLIVDIGKNTPPFDIYTHLGPQLNKIKMVRYHLSDKIKASENFIKNTCSWIDAKNTDNVAVGTQWKRTSNVVKRVFKSIETAFPLKPFLFIFDCSKSSAYAVKFIQFLLDDDVSLPKGSKFIVLGKPISDDDVATLKENGYSYKFIEEANLIDVAETIEKFFPKEDTGYSKDIVLPSLEHLSGYISESEYANYSSTFEIIYSGLAARSSECDYGISFYKGGEIKWIDLDNKVEIDVLPDYKSKLEELKNKLEKTIPRVQTLRLCHSAGSGGTTLSKRLLWDIKDINPCIFLKKYTSRTADNIVELYQKTGKTIFAVFEFGSTVMTEEEFISLKAKVNANSVRVIFMRVERMHFSQPFNEVEENDEESIPKPFITIESELDKSVAGNFYNKYSSMTDDIERIRCLEGITYHWNDERWIDQCCPFFYGFYTFKDEYNIDGFISRTIKNCSEDEKNLLSDVSIMTIYSQNLCISYDELVLRLNLDPENESPYLAHEKFDEAIVKLLIRRDDGWRLCNVLIARKVLQTIYSKDDYKDAIYDALLGLINRLSNIYSADSKYVHSVIKELVIDRSYIDGEKMKFSDIITDIAERNKRQNIFNELILRYPDNPHYYNHLGRLYTEHEPYSFNKAINCLEKAIDIANNDDEWGVHPHCTTLACIYSKKIKERLKELRTNKHQDRWVPSVDAIIYEIAKEYDIASDLFLRGREANKHNSYGYFPNILMICRIVEGIVNCDTKDRTLSELIDVNTEFKCWYDTNICKANQLIRLMESNCYDIKEDGFIHISKARLEGVLEDIKSLKGRLSVAVNNQSKSAAYTRRTCISSLYARNKYSWDNLDISELEIVKTGMMQNLYVSDKKDQFRSNDVHFWFEAYRRLPGFDESEAISIINDYIEDNYRKSYLLYILEFSRYVKGVCGVSEFKKHINNCVQYSSQEYGLKTSAYIDTYIEGNSVFPIVDIRSVRDDEGDFKNLKLFKGIITDIQGTTKGYIKVNDLNIEVMFTPSFSDAEGNRREFTSNNITDSVEFNLMFTYSGIRAWNVKRLD